MFRRSEQGFERFVRVDRAQGPGRLQARAVKRVVVQTFLEFGHGFLVLFRAQLVDGEQPPDRVILVRELRVENWLRCLKLDFRQQRVVGVKPDDLRRFGQGKIKILFLFLYLNLAVRRPEFPLEPDGKREVEEQNIVAQRLSLLDGDLRQFGDFIPTVGDFEFRMMRVVEPLFEELVVGTPGKLLDHRAEIFGHDVVELMAFQVRLDAAAIKVFAELRAEHVEHPPAFGIGQIAEHFAR